MEKKATTFDEILNEQAIPAIAADQEGIIFFVNRVFEEKYGWSKDDLIGSPLTTIIPPFMRDAHNLGFAHFLSTQGNRILDKEISLPVYCKDGSTREVTHFITAQRVDEEWQFAALLYPDDQ